MARGMKRRAAGHIDPRGRIKLCIYFEPRDFERLMKLVSTDTTASKYAVELLDKAMAREEFWRQQTTAKRDAYIRLLQRPDLVQQP